MEKRSHLGNCLGDTSSVNRDPVGKVDSYFRPRMYKSQQGEGVLDQDGVEARERLPPFAFSQEQLETSW